MNKNILKDFIIDTANNLLGADIDQDKCNNAIFSQRVNISAWGAIHIIDELNKKYNFVYDASDLVANPDFSINDMVESIYSQLKAQL